MGFGRFGICFTSVLEQSQVQNCPSFFPQVRWFGTATTTGKSTSQHSILGSTILGVDGVDERNSKKITVRILFYWIEWLRLNLRDCNLSTKGLKYLKWIFLQKVIVNGKNAESIALAWDPFFLHHIRQKRRFRCMAHSPTIVWGKGVKHPNYQGMFTTTIHQTCLWRVVDFPAKHLVFYIDPAR